MNLERPTIGILGAGKVGVVLGQLARRAGYAVMMASSRPARDIALTVETLVPGAEAKDAAELARQADIVILALPLSSYKNIPKKQLAGKLVIDAMNYWWEVDGERDDFIPANQPSSLAVQEYLADSQVVKAFNHMGYHDLHDESREAGEPGRKAIAIAGDEENDVAKVAELVDELGFDPLAIGSLERGALLEAGQPAFGASLDKAALAKIISG